MSDSRDPVKKSLGAAELLADLPPMLKYTAEKIMADFDRLTEKISTAEIHFVDAAAELRKLRSRIRDLGEAVTQVANGRA